MLQNEVFRIICWFIAVACGGFILGTVTAFLKLRTPLPRRAFIQIVAAYAVGSMALWAVLAPTILIANSN